jgi:polyferredoxin
VTDRFHPSLGQLRLALALLGFALALLSVALDSRVCGWVAIGVLIVSLLSRLAGRRRSGGNGPAEGL